MPSLVTTAHLQATSKEARDQLLSLFSDIVNFSLAQEPGVLRYCIATADDPSNETSIFAMEEYVDQAASDAHLATPVVQALITAMSSTPPLLAAAPEVHSLPSAITYTRPSVSKCADPFIIMATFTYQPGQTGTALIGWREFVRAAEAKESKTLSYTIIEDKAACQIRTVEVYESKEFMYDVHLESEAVKRNQEQNGGLRIEGGNSAVKCRMACGFLVKGEEL